MSKDKQSISGPTLVTMCICILFVCLTVESISHSNDKRDVEIESLKIEKQHELEVTKQKAIEHDKSRKRKIWEREMTPEDKK